MAPATIPANPLRSVLGLVGVCIASLLLLQCGPPRAIQMPNKPYHHLQNGFRNPSDSIERVVPFRERWRVMRKIIRNSGQPHRLPQQFLQPRPQALAELATHAKHNSISWLGHATFLLNVKGVRVLTDPMFSTRASPVRFLGPKRIHDMPLQIADLPPLDIVIVSHAHYDHLDMPSLRALPNKDKILALVPLGLGKYLKAAGYTQVQEMDWYDTVTHKGVQVIAYPAVHWANRSLFDVNRTLWMSYAISDGTYSVYHTGDTEWHDSLFHDIGKHMKAAQEGCDIALLSVGAYEPRNFMRGTHAAPEDMVRIGQAIGCALMVPMHWGTFVLSTEPVLEPYERFNNAAGNQALNMKIGETRALASLISR